eukprot:1748376-Pleurochrysis_carterae.AAC.2
MCVLSHTRRLTKRALRQKRARARRLCARTFGGLVGLGLAGGEQPDDDAVALGERHLGLLDRKSGLQARGSGGTSLARKKLSF